jgi:hypothetical protein
MPDAAYTYWNVADFIGLMVALWAMMFILDWIWPSNYEREDRQWVFGIEADAGWGSTSGSNVIPDGFLLENDIRFLAMYGATRGSRLIACFGSWPAEQP